MTAAIELVWQESYGAVTVDAICERAGVKKGSFYYFFQSKDDLIAAALEAHWESMRPELDRMFSPSVPALERLRTYFDAVYAWQVEHRKRVGRVLGCPYTSLGCEVSRTNNRVICDKVQALLQGYYRYFECALRDAQAEGLIPGKDVRALARALFAYKEGVVTQARIQDDPELIRGLWPGTLNLLGLEPSNLASAS